LEILELNKWTRFTSAWKNPLKKLILHENYGTGRFYNISFDLMEEIVFFVNEDCCTLENLENFQIVIHSFGDLSTKKLDVNEWICKFEKTVEYQSQNGRVLNNVCRRQNNSIVSDSESSTKDEIRSIEDSSPNPNIFVGKNIETLGETTHDPDTETAIVVEISTLTYDEKVEKGIWKSLKRKVSGWKNKAVKKWNDWTG
jgi:hypothetical protein